MISMVGLLRLLTTKVEMLEVEMNIHEKVVAPQQKNKRPPGITQEQGISSRPTNVTSESLRKQEEEENMVYVYV